MDLVEFTEYLVKSLVSDPEEVRVKEFPTDELDTILIQIIVNNEDVGKIIGKNGKLINSIKTLVQAKSYLNDNKKVKINIDSF